MTINVPRKLFFFQYESELMLNEAIKRLYLGQNLVNPHLCLFPNFVTDGLPKVWCVSQESHCWHLRDVTKQVRIPGHQVPTRDTHSCQPIVIKQVHWTWFSHQVQPLWTLLSPNYHPAIWEKSSFMEYSHHQVSTWDPIGVSPLTSHPIALFLLCSFSAFALSCSLKFSQVSTVYTLGMSPNSYPGHHQVVPGPGTHLGPYWGVTGHPIVSCSKGQTSDLLVTINFEPTAIFVGPSLEI